MTIMSVSEATADIDDTTTMMPNSSSPSSGSRDGVSNILIAGVSVAASVIIFILVVVCAVYSWRSRSGQHTFTADQAGVHMPL